MSRSCSLLRSFTLVAAVAGLCLLALACTSRQETSASEPEAGTSTPASPQPSVTGSSSEIIPQTPPQTRPTQTSQALLPTITATSAVPARVLTVCLGQEPESLFLYQALSASARSVLQAIYDGPIDLRSFIPQPVILERIPSLANGDAGLESVLVNPGDPVVDSLGTLTVLAEGLSYRPSGCFETACAQVYNAGQPAAVDQLVVRFSFLPGLLWSDGSPLTADDSVYSYEVARALFTQGQYPLVDLTASYRVVEAQRVEWRGVPGYQPPRYQEILFTPLPRHAWGLLPPQDLLSVDMAVRTPLGWGPYVIDQWVSGDHLTLSRNPHYFRLAEGLPGFDHLVYRFVDSSAEALAAVLAGECDLIDPSAALDVELSQLQALQTQGKVAVSYQVGTAWEVALFGIAPLDPQQPALFRQKEVRQAIAQCLDRSTLAQSLFAGQSQGLDSYVSALHPLYNPAVEQTPYDPAAAAQLLDLAGWLDLDGDPATPRLAQGVAGIANGTPLAFEYLTAADAERPQAAEAIRLSLAQCGIEVLPVLQDAAQYLAAGPDGAVFGRHFQMAQLAWPVSVEPPCFLFSSAEIPGPYPDFPKGWGGANASGYNNPAFDQACSDARNSLMDWPGHRQAHDLAQAIFSQEVPAIPLYLRFSLAVARPDLCGMVVDPSQATIFSALESVDYGPDCQSP